jgi:hypothetical protein
MVRPLQVFDLALQILNFVLCGSAFVFAVLQPKGAAGDKRADDPEYRPGVHIAILHV